MRHLIAVEHRPIRPWWAPWHKRCRCGRDLFSCTSDLAVRRRAGTVMSRAERPAINPPQRWNGPTTTMLPLLTLGQQHRGGWPTNAERRPRDCRSDFPR